MAGGPSLRKKKPTTKRLNLHSQQLPMPPPLPLAPSSPFNFRKMSLFISVVSILGLIFIFSISSNIWGTSGSGVASVQLYSIQVVNEFPHDPDAFTQGLLYGGDDTLFESTGLNGRSSVRRVALHTGKVETMVKMDDSYFGEGLTLLGERLFQVTWLDQTGFIYDRNNLSKFEKFTHQMQDGWGLATDGKVLFGSDGTSTLYQIDPQLMKGRSDWERGGKFSVGDSVTAKQIVKYKGREVHNLNELEYINNEVWANIWQSNCIARISPKDGTVRSWILLHELRDGLLAAGKRSIDVLNGIAWDKDNNRLFVTGKLWPKLYEIKLHPVRKPIHGSIEQICMRKPVHF